MSESFQILFPGKPVGKGRPRFNKTTGSIRTPDKTKVWEKAFAWEAKKEARRAGWDAGDESPAGVDVIAVFARPQRHRFTGREWRKGTPDGDNVLKAVADGLQKAGVIHNDTQLVEWKVRSVYGAEGETAHVEVRVYRAGEVSCAV